MAIMTATAEEAKMAVAEGKKLDEKMAENEANFAVQERSQRAQGLREERRQAEERTDATLARLKAEALEAEAVADEAAALAVRDAKLAAAQAKGRAAAQK